MYITPWGEGTRKGRRTIRQPNGIHPHALRHRRPPPRLEPERAPSDREAVVGVLDRAWWDGEHRGDVGRVLREVRVELADAVLPAVTIAS